MKALGKYAADAIVFGLIVVLLAPAVARAAASLAVPVIASVALVCVLRLIWFWTSL